jgi:hypothetical protein
MLFLPGRLGPLAQPAALATTPFGNVSLERPGMIFVMAPQRALRNA